jgi:hypothetical protein
LLPPIESFGFTLAMAPGADFFVQGFGGVPGITAGRRQSQKR